jgi:methionyl-tRNA formyltransferase
VTSPLKVIFAGTPEFAASVLQALLDSPYQVIACYTQPDRPAGRGRKLTPSPVKELALQHDIPVYQPLNFKQADDVATLKALGADIMVVVAYGLILPQSVLDAPRLGCVNVHASILPRWRGAAPIQRAIAAGDSESGVTIMQMDKGLDTGAMLLKVFTPISQDDTGGSLHDRLAQLGAPALVETLGLLAEGKAQPETQDHALATYAHKLTKEEAKLDWSRSASDLHNLIRAFNPWPVCHTTLDGETIRVWKAERQTGNSQAEPGTLLDVSKDGITVATGGGLLRLTELQLPGGKCLPVVALLNSRADWLTPGKRFT